MAMIAALYCRARCCTGFKRNSTNIQWTGYYRVIAKGWVRAAKGHDVDAQSLNYRSGDGYLDAVLGRTTQPVFVLDTSGRVYTTTTHDLPSARSQGEPLTGRLKPPVGALFTHLWAGHEDDWILLVSDAGYGFRVQLKDWVSKTRPVKWLLVCLKVRLYWRQ